MDIDLLSKMVKDLILKSDKVALPGVGTFVCELVPATFSDKGFVINPPYRKLSFRQRLDDEDTALADLYASGNGVSQEEADGIIREFLKGMKDVLIKNKVIVFPGLGRLRATKENAFFFVQDEDLDIYPDGFGLEPVSLKSVGGDPLEEAPAASEVDSSTAPEPERTASEDNDEVLSAVQNVDRKEQKPGENAVSGPENGPLTAPPAEAQPAEAPVQPEHPAQPAEAPTPTPKKSRWLGRTVGLLALVALLLLLALAIVGRVAPEFVDKLLYNAEELRILNS